MSLAHRSLRGLMAAILLAGNVTSTLAAPDPFVEAQMEAARQFARSEREARKPKPAEAAAPKAVPAAKPEKPAELPVTAKQAATPEQSAATSPQRTQTALTTLNVTVEPTLSGVQLVYPWDVVVAAAAFKRGDAIWVVFERKVAVRHEDLLGASGERLDTAMSVPAGEATVIRYAARPGARIAMRRDGPVWRLDVKDTPIVARASLKIVSAARDNGPAVPFVEVEEPGAIVHLSDPASGERFQVAPMIQPSLGLPQQTLQTAGTFLTTAQGLALIPSSPFARLERFRDGVALAGTAAATGADMLNARGFSSTSAGEKLIDLQKWALVAPDKFVEKRGQLLYELSQLPVPARQDKRWQLARFYLGHGLAADALGILEVMAKADPALTDNGPFIAARGVAQLKLRHFADARTDLDRGILDAEPDIYLWRAMASEALGEPQVALSQFEKGADVIGWYDAPERLAFQLSGIRSALAAGNPAIAKRELDLLPKKGIAPYWMGEVHYLRGRLALENKDPATAAARFASAQALPNREAAARAALAQIEDELARGVVKSDVAINRLDRLRYGWRGDVLEQRMLQALGSLYQHANDWRAGFEMLRQAVKYFPPSDETRMMTARLESDFRKLFLEGAADSLQPIAALALYYDFRELTPLGADGDTMIRKLADRLVSVELLDRAAGLLDHQVRFRLEGVAQATVANRLAMIHLLNNDPEAAIGVLRMTRQTTLTPDVRIERNRIEARALVSLGKTSEAIAMIDTDASPIADDLRAEAAWKDKDWPQVIVHAGRTLAQVPATGMLEADPARHAVRAAIANVMTGNATGLADLNRRYASRFADKDLQAAFAALTSGSEELAETGPLSDILASVDRLQGGLDAYKKAFAVPARPQLPAPKQAQAQPAAAKAA